MLNLLFFSKRLITSKFYKKTSIFAAFFFVSIPDSINCIPVDKMLVRINTYCNKTFRHCYSIIMVVRLLLAHRLERFRQSRKNFSSKSDFGCCLVVKTFSKCSVLKLVHSIYTTNSHPNIVLTEKIFTFISTENDILHLKNIKSQPFNKYNYHNKINTCSILRRIP